MSKLKRKIKATHKFADDLIKQAERSHLTLIDWLEVDIKTVSLKNGHYAIVLLAGILLYIL